VAKVILENITKSFGKTEVVHGVNAHFDDGEFIVIVGPSGCGKSTVLRMIAGLEEVSGGTINIGDKLVNDLEPKDRRIAMVFQNYALYPHMNVYNNMAYGLKLQKHSKTEIERRVQDAAQLLQLEEYLQRKPRQLSGGQRQRVAMGRALVRKPEVFLFDEPLSNLDAKLRHQMRVELKKLHKNLRTTMIYVTHDQVEAMTLADKIVVINKGRIEQVGAPDEIYNSPASMFVAGFIGSPPMNFLTAEMTELGLRFENGYTVDATNLSVPADTRQLVVGIRPEKVEFSYTPREDGWLEISIDFIEKLGAGKLLYSSLGKEQLVMSMANGHDRHVVKGWVRLPAEALYLFSQQDGKLLTEENTRRGLETRQAGY